MRVQKSLHNLIGGTGVKLAICSSILCLFCSRTPALADPCPASDTCPTGLTATPEGPNEVMLQWTQPVSPDVSGFKVSESPQAAGQVFDLSTGPADDPRSQPIANLQAGTSYTIFSMFDASKFLRCQTSDYLASLYRRAPACASPSIVNVVYREFYHGTVELYRQL